MSTRLLLVTKRKELLRKAQCYVTLTNDFDDKYSESERKLFNRKHYKCRRKARELLWRIEGVNK